MRFLLILWLAGSAASAPPQGHLGSDLQPPPAPTHQQQQVASKRFGFSSGGESGSMFGKIAHWLFPTGSDSPPHPGRSIARSPYVHGPPRGHPPPQPQKFYGGPSHPKSAHPPPPPQKCNPCNKVPWVPIPHAQYQDGANVFAVVNAPQLHQGLHGGSQPNVPVYHHSPLPQGYLPTFVDNNYNQRPDQALVPSASGAGVSSGSGSAPEVIPSIPIADFVASIEYPVNIVQSPIIDLGSDGPGHKYKSLDNVNAEAVEHANHNTDHFAASTGTSDDGDANLGGPQSVPLLINTEIGSTSGDSSSYQNVNLHAEHTEHKEVHSGPSDVSITPSIQTSVDQQSHSHENQQHENVQLVYKPVNFEGTVPPPVPTQQQPPHPNPPAPFHIQTFQQPPSAQAPTLFNAGFPASAPNRFVPPHPQAPIFFNNPLPNFQHPPRGFSSPGLINSLRQVPSAPDLSPPPPPPSGHPYRFEFGPPSGNALQNLNQPTLSESPTIPPTIDYTPWALSSGHPTIAPHTADVAPLSSSHAGKVNNDVNIQNKRPKLIHQIVIPYTVPSQNNLLDVDSGSGLRSQWHHREINHQFQESRIQEQLSENATTTLPPPVVTSARSTTVHHILSSDIRSFLRAEQQRQQQQKILQPNPNLVRLQNNIDQWTAQEFSNDLNNIELVEDSHKVTTAAGTLAPSKIIPSEYFATSPSSYNTFYPSTTQAPFDHEAAGSISHNVHAKTRTAPKITKIAVDVVESTTENDVISTVTTTEEPATTTEEPRRTTWEQALLGYSSTTKEKVYVVTPMSTHQWTDVTTPRPRVSTTTSTEKITKGFVIKGRGSSNKQASTTAAPTKATPTAFQSPRFTVRPTPGPRGSDLSAPGEVTNRGNRYYTVPTPLSYQPPTTARSSTIERRSTSGFPADWNILPTVSPQEVQNVHISSKPSKVVTVVTSSSSSSSPHVNKKATRLEVKPVVKPIVPQEGPIDDFKDIEVAAAVREVSAIEIKHKPSS
ncbi:hypothetical protein B566_EDAN002797 [Ephemera danica]|nr:hypothetical protein B566_EDAN002797 [Ephemera danica]